jgi:hypothetical protein
MHSAIGTSIAFVLRNFTAIGFVVALVCAALSRRGPVADRYLRWLLLLPIGLGGLWSGFFHVAFPELAAHFIGWQNSPFQFEVGMADLAIGVTACIAFGSSHGFKAATVVVNAVFLFGDAIGHIHQMFAANNFASGNAGPVFYLDIILPIATIVLLFLSRSSDTSGRAAD